MSQAPHWERGYRSHGYWIGIDRIGVVGLGKRGAWDGMYSWRIDGTELSGSESSLRSAKRIIESLSDKSGETSRRASQSWK